MRPPIQTLLHCLQVSQVPCDVAALKQTNMYMQSNIDSTAKKRASESSRARILLISLSLNVYRMWNRKCNCSVLKCNRDGLLRIWLICLFWYLYGVVCGWHLNKLVSTSSIVGNGCECFHFLKNWAESCYVLRALLYFSYQILPCLPLAWLNGRKSYFYVIEAIVAKLNKTRKTDSKLSVNVQKWEIQSWRDLRLLQSID